RSAPSARTGRIATLRATLREAAASPRMLWAALGLLTLLWLASSGLALKHLPRALTQEDIDAAVLKTLNTVPLPSPAAKAYETIAPSVVRVTSYVHKSRLKTDKNGKPVESNSLALSTDPENPDEVEMGVGTGVVIVDKGVILTNLHVVQGADRIMVTFSDGLRAQADVTGAQPENDLAVLQARKIPDDLFAATMKSTAELAPGEQVLAVGYPFGIGPSASAGIVSGLKRSFRSPEGQQEMRNLIQFDAAANPGNSGGPLVTMDGQVVGIVTAILNPTSARTFIGIGFAVPIENAASAVGVPPF
ncbi:MAG: peptidase S1, partial [Betaproteobacteria bacterium]|nr:peptidase S1 [Betaproteobacteria bacterium]